MPKKLLKSFIVTSIVEQIRSERNSGLVRCLDDGTWIEVGIMLREKRLDKTFDELCWSFDRLKSTWQTLEPVSQVIYPNPLEHSLFNQD
jgi:hypothetical protein